MAPQTRSLHRYDEERALAASEIDAPARRHHDPVGAASRVVGLALKLTLLAILLTALAGLLGLVGVGGRATSGFGDRIGGAIERGANAFGTAVQTVRDAADPAHPPRQALAQDAEFEELIRLDVGSSLAGSNKRTLVVTGIHRREQADNPDATSYATVHTELNEPQENRVLGVVVGTTRDPRDFYLYKGESFRLGRRLYKVNWVSPERQQIAVAAYRDPDRVIAPLKFQSD